MINQPGTPRTRPGFTLIELLIVIAIISILAAMIFPISKALNRTKMRSRVKAELSQMETALESYKTKIGVYPPDNPGNPRLNPLYYELVGTTLENNTYRPMDGSPVIAATPATLQSVYGPQVSGLINVARPGGGDESTGGHNFLKGLNAMQIGVLSNMPTPVRVLVTSVGWPRDRLDQPIPTTPGLNPWRYVSSNPTNNPNSYDLWVDILVDGKTNRISNWSQEPIIVR